MNRLILRSLSACMALLVFQSCTVWMPLHKNEDGAITLPDEYQTYYDYPHASELPEELLLREEHRKYIYEEIEIPLSLPAEMQRNDLAEFMKATRELASHDRKKARDQSLFYTNRFSVYIPKGIKPGERRPAVLVSPILGGNMVVDLFAAFYAKRGYIAVIVHRKKPYLSDDAQDFSEIEVYLRSTIIRLRQAVDWLETRPDVDPGRIVSFGVSYGAILHSVLAAVEPRIRYHILAMPAAPLAETIIECPDRAMVKLVTKAREQFNWSDEEVYQELKMQIKTDPFYLAPYIPRKRVQVYIALFDRVVGAGRSWGLWKEMQKPNLKLMPFGHYGGVLVFPYLQWRSYWSFVLKVGL